MLAALRRPVDGLLEREKDEQLLPTTRVVTHVVISGTFWAADFNSPLLTAEKIPQG